MSLYMNRGGNSNITEYELYDGGIRVSFQDRSCYLYTISSAGVSNIQEMHRLAVDGRGLNSFINRYVSKKYESKSKF